MKITEMGGVETILRKLVFAAATLLGVGYIVIDVPIVILLGYKFVEIPIDSMQNITRIASTTLFLMASVLLIVLGCFFIIGGLQFYRGGAHQGVIFLGSLLASFYLLCFGAGSLLIDSQLNLGGMLLTVSPVLIMVAAAVYMGRSSPFKLVGSVLGIAGGIFLALGLLSHQTIEVVFEWGVRFPGPFMSMAVMEAIVVILGSVTAFIYSVFAERKEEPVSHVFLSIVALVYGIGVFIGSQVLALELLDLLWKSSYEGAVLFDLPQWFSGTVAFWSASLFLLMIGGIVLIASSCIGFIFAAQEFTQV
ncbi:MAG: hypothetical protein JSW19_00020 [Candidatus Bathyarchaeota archaeon]|nr:MAG: hypothetical protein JSW19_00020 [Candidatus Bathyarchaeota archaeon]